MWRRGSGREVCLNSRRRDVRERWGVMRMPFLLGLDVVWDWEQGEGKCGQSGSVEGGRDLVRVAEGSARSRR